MWYFIISAAAPGHVCYSNEHCRLWDKESRCEFVILNLFGRCACNSNFRQIGDKCVPHKPYATETIIADDSLIGTPVNGTLKSSNPTISSDDIGFPNTIKIDDKHPSKIPMFTSKNDVYDGEEDNPFIQTVLKIPSSDSTKRGPVTNRKDGEPNETISVDELTASLHANDQPIYRVVTKPSTDKKGTKKGGASKEQTSNKPHKAGHQKKSSSKGRFSSTYKFVSFFIYFFKLLIDNVFVF